jgi:hypothetical protein
MQVGHMLLATSAFYRKNVEKLLHSIISLKPTFPFKMIDPKATENMHMSPKCNLIG